MSSLPCRSCSCAANSCATCRAPADCTNCAACCCNDIHQSWIKTRTGAGIKIEYFSSACMTVEVIGSVWSGLIAGSFALLAFGGDSLVELLWYHSPIVSPKAPSKPYYQPRKGRTANKRSTLLTNSSNRTVGRLLVYYRT